MKIDPDRLSSLRKKTRLTRLELEKKSGINKRTIQRSESKSESQRSQNSQEHTVNSLAKALGVKAGVLTGELPLHESGKAPDSDSERVQIRAQVAPKARLAYDLIKLRYDVSAAEIISMAPLFFALLAEGSLAWRREKLQEVEETKSRLEQIEGFWRGGFVSGSVVMDGGIAREGDSIAKADLFGEHLFSDSDATFIEEDEPFDPSTDNPFASYLRKLEDELDITGVVDVGSDHLRFGSPLKFPDYNICRDELDGIANGSHFAKIALEAGDVRLSEIPEELMAEDAGEERAEWLEGKLSDTRRDVEKEFIDIIRELRKIPKDDLEKWLKESDFMERLGSLSMYRDLLHSGILDPDGTLRKAIEEGTISNEELDRLFSGETLEEENSQETNSNTEKGGDDQ